MHPQQRSFVLFSLVLLLTGCGIFPGSQTKTTQSAASQTATNNQAQPYSDEDYAAVLNTYVNEQGQVNYAKLKENRAGLDRYNQSLGNVAPETFQSWSEAEKIAFLVNAYNSLTLQAILDHYPVDSIRKIPGVWKSLKFQVLGQPTTLDEIEHQILRKEFNEPRIHMALVCASVGCPNLLREPYRGATLDQQLDANTQQFFSLDRNFKLDAKAQKVYLSSIFDWFGQDFEKTYGTEDKFKTFSAKERSILNFASQYVNAEQLTQLQQVKKLSYLDYDWSLNRQ